jgi:hypothetical protein
MDLMGTSTNLVTLILEIIMVFTVSGWYGIQLTVFSPFFLFFLCFWHLAAKALYCLVIVDFLVLWVWNDFFQI